MSPHPDNTVYAAIDLGSNSFHLLLAQFESGRIVIVDRYKECIRLAQGLQNDGSLSNQSIGIALASLQRFAERIKSIDPACVRVVGTNTFRAAKNADQFLAQTEATLGVPVDVISGAEEARLIYLGVAQDFSPEHYTRLVIDIGGGSTELVLGKERPDKLESLHMGCVTYTQRYFQNGLSESNFQRAVWAARAEIQAVAFLFDQSTWQQAVGASGTIRAIERILDQQNDRHEHLITPEGLEGLVGKVINAGDINSIMLPGLEDDRRVSFVGGLAILVAVFQELGVDAMHVSNYSLREGIIHDLAGRHCHHDKRQETIQQIISQYRVDQEQSARIRRLALYMLVQVKADIQADIEHAARLLTWAIDLHEIGLTISHSGYHKHGAYLITNCDVPGFSRQEQKQLGFLILNHRRKLRKMEKAYGFEPDWHLVVVLRLACLFNRRRDDHAIPPEIRLRFQGNCCCLSLPADWLAVHPLTEQDLEAESQYLNDIEYELHIERI